MDDPDREDPVKEKAISDIAGMLEELTDLPTAVAVRARDALANILWL